MNDALNTFYLRLYGVRLGKGPISERGNPLPTHGLLFPIISKGSFIFTIPHRIAHTTAFVTLALNMGVATDSHSQYIVHYVNSVIITTPALHV